MDTPTGNIDMAPTVLRILGIPGGDSMEGRVLEEALANGPEAGAVDWSTELHNAERRLGLKIGYDRHHGSGHETPPEILLEHHGKARQRYNLHAIADGRFLRGLPAGQ